MIKTLMTLSDIINPITFYGQRRSSPFIVINFTSGGQKRAAQKRAAWIMTLYVEVALFVITR